MGVNGQKYSMYKGVSFNKKLNKWVATIKVKGLSIGLGFFDESVDASTAYEKASINKGYCSPASLKDAHDEYVSKVLDLLSVDVQVYKDNLAEIFMDTTSSEFYDFIENSIEFDVRLRKTPLYIQYLEVSSDRHPITQRMFSVWVDKYIKHKDYDSTQGRDAVSRWITVSEKE